MDTSIFDKAVKFAVDAHSGVERRGKGFPYIIHPMEAAQIVSTMTADQELLAAAVLHDTVEDTCVTLEQIRSEFGERVASMVMSETSPATDESGAALSWRDRKRKSIELIKNSSFDSKIVSLGDKLSNIRTMSSDYAQIGDDLWSRFHAPDGKKDLAWYYNGLVEALSPLEGKQAYDEFENLVNIVFNNDEKKI